MTAGRVILAVAFEHVRNGEQGLFVHLLQLDEETGELSVRTVGNSLPIPATPIIGIGATINTRG